MTIDYGTPRLILICTDEQIALKLIKLAESATKEQAKRCMLITDSIRPEQPTNYGVRIGDWYNWEDSPQ